MSATTSEAQLKELGAFLRTRRGELTPHDAGLPDHDRRRRVSGLRREEVAALASISTDYYTRIEQGRLAPSAPVLAALIDALHLDPDQAEYLDELANRAGHQPVSTSVPRTTSRIRPQVRRIVDRLTDTPAIVLGPRMQILAWNPLAAKVYVDFDELSGHELNFVRLVFVDPRMRELFVDWQAVARSCVSILRREAVANPGDPALAALVGELTIADRQFGQWWSARNVARQDFGTKVLNHPQVGELTLDWEIFRYAGAPEQQLVLNIAEEGSATEERLRELVR